ncbi:protein-L-histidine N-pros-methyltransferase isoform X2 [Hetaerina americana]
MPPHLASRFIQMGVDEGTEAFLEQSKEKSEWIFTQLWYSLARPFFGWFMSQTSVNGLLGRGSMFVFSKTQFLKLLGKDYQDSCQPIEFDKNLHFNGLVGGNAQELSDDSHQGNPCKTVLNIEPGPFFDGSLLDLGAGDGGITEIIAKMFKSGVYVTEISPPMKRTLAKKGFHVLDENSWHKEDIPRLRIAMCLNLLDRCETPLTLLSNLRDTLKKNAKEKPLLIVALVLPYSTYVETGSSSDHKPKEIITIQGSTFEDQVVSVERDLFIPAGFEILQWTRLPYLCEGDLRQAYYWLSDSVFVLTPASDASDGNGDSNAS